MSGQLSFTPLFGQLSVVDNVLIACETTRRTGLGEAEVEIGLEATHGGTMVTMDEDAASGPGRLVPKPARAALIKWRNTEALRRLALLVENRETANRVS